MTDGTNPRPSEAEVWAGPMGERWLASYAQFEGMIAPAGEALIAAAKFAPGEKVIDIGCGAGATSLEIARLVAPNGSVTGLDISAALIGACESRARDAGLTNTRFLVGDAAAADVGGPIYDRLVSRFGIMFFEDPYGAFRHMHGFLRPDGRLIFTCWAPVSENAWIQVVQEVSKRYAPAPPPVPRTPGPFAFDDPDYVRDILSKAGFRDIEIALWRGDQLVGGAGADPGKAAGFILENLGLGDALADRPEEVQRQARTELEAAFKPFHGPDGVRTQAGAWIVTARA